MTDPGGKPLDQSIHPDIPEDRAWKTGRRIYITCGYKSQLSSALYGIGAKWDRDEHALWVGSGKKEQVIALIGEHEKRIAETGAVKASGLWVKIPFAAENVRDQAKKLGAKWDKGRKEWAMPTEAALGAVEELLAEHELAASEAKAAAKVKQAAAKAENAAEAARTDEDIIASSGRILVSDERIEIHGLLQGYMKRPEAEKSKPGRGEVVKIKGGTRVLVLKSKAEFWDQDACDDLAPHEDPGWRWFAAGVRVEPSAGEAAEEAEKAAVKADGDAIAALIAARKDWDMEYLPETGAGKRVPADQVAGRISVSYGSQGNSDGHLTLTRDGEVVWYHPGHYDDWRRTEGRTRNPEAANQVRAVLAGGPRTRASDRCTCTVEVTMTWRELFPEGRHVFYEGTDPDEFRQQIRDEFSFDPGSDPGWGARVGDESDPGSSLSYGFDCPPAHLDAIYGSDRFPLGS